MSFLENAWYAAAWSHEIGRKLFERTIIGQSLVFYRRENGEVVALSNRCPHRFSPLHLGKLVGDLVECPYHGLQYDARGHCVRNPHGEKLPTKARLSAFPVVERHNLIWIWPGDAERADAKQIPDFSCLTEGDGFRTVGGTIQIDAHYELIADNLMDLTHAQYVHEGLLGSEAISRGERDVQQDGTTVWSNLWCPDGLAPPAWDAAFDHYGKPVDHWIYMRWDAPAHMLLDVGVTPPSKSRSEGVWVYGTDILTPQDAGSTHYFWGLSRNYALADTAIDEGWRKSIEIAFEGQDKPMIEAQFQMMQGQTFDELNPVLLACDAGPQRARKVLGKLIRDATPPNPAKGTLAERRAAARDTDRIGSAV